MSREPLIVHDPGNHLDEIQTLWAVVSVDERGKEGLCGYPMPGSLSMPMIGADPDNLARLIQMAQQLGKLTNKQLKLIKLTTREVVRVFDPPTG